MLEYLQMIVRSWMHSLYKDNPVAIKDKRERTFRFIEEAIELTQAAGLEKQDILDVLEYVYSREKGKVPQEVGGVLITLAAMCDAFNHSMSMCAETEVVRIQQPEVMDKILSRQIEKRKRFN